MEFGELKDISSLTKLIFLVFVILMSIVLINLVMGLTISDVVSLRLVIELRVSFWSRRTQSIIIEVKLIE